MTESISAILERHDLFKRLSAFERERLAEIATRQTSEPQTLLYRQGEPAAGMFVIVDGQVELSRVNRQGRKFVLAGLSTSDTFGELALLDGDVRPVTATTLSATDVVFIPADAFAGLLAGHQRVAMETLTLLSLRASSRLRELNRTIVDTLSTPTALASERQTQRARPDRDYFHGLMAGLYGGTE